jgi:alcohol dehydrogenase class IV
MKDFVYESLPGRVIFGAGSIEKIGEEVRRLGGKRAVVLATEQQQDDARKIAATLGGLSVGVFAGAVMHTPVERTEEALAFVQSREADCLVAFGGGSTIGLGKAIALRTGLPQMAVPTTYAGSEMTPILGQTENGIKTTQRTLDVLPECVIYDVNLTLSLPVKLSMTSGINAVAHAVEALYARDNNPIISLAAEHAIAKLAHALPVILQHPQDIEARAAALYGSWLCGMCLGSVGMAVHHKLCHTIGGLFNLPHAETHTVILPHAVAFNAHAAPEAMAALSRALGGGPPALALFDLAGRLGAEQSLSGLGMPQTGIDTAADHAVANPYWNPRPIERGAIRDLIAAAWAGERPAAQDLSVR